MIRRLLICTVLPLAACSSTASGADGGDASDLVTVDVSASDAGTDAVSDVPDDVSQDSAPDAGTLVGRWRMVGLDINLGTTPLHFTDANSPIAGSAAVGRCNGLMNIEDNRLAIAYGVLANDHFLPRQDAPTYAEALAAAGVTAAGTLSGTSFSFVGGTMVNWTANPDGTISQHDATSGNVTTWARTGTLPSMAALLAQGLAVRYQPTTAMPLMHPRVALAWDNAGGSGVTLSNDTALVFGAMGYATFPSNIVSIPPAALASIDGTQVAIAYVIVYDDLDASGSYTLSTGDAGAGDVLRGFSPVGIAYRSDATPSAAFALSSLRDIGPGYQFVSVHIDYASGTAGVSPFDPTHAVAPDVAVDTGPLSFGIPDLVP